jgi:hypothetical protein
MGRSPRNVDRGRGLLQMDCPTNLMVISSVLWFDEPLDWAATQAVLRARMVDRLPRLRQRAVDGRPGGAPTASSESSVARRPSWKSAS